MDIATDWLVTVRDYAHLNSIEMMADGNLLLSFRHLSQVMKVDRATGEVMWRLGGVRSDFIFPDDPYGGPCAQHTAVELANGDIQIWDNGSQVTSTDAEPMCPDPADPDGPRVERPFSRVDRVPAGRDREHRRPGAGDRDPDVQPSSPGSAQRLGGRHVTDNVFVGHRSGADPTAASRRSRSRRPRRRARRCGPGRHGLVLQLPVRSSTPRPTPSRRRSNVANPPRARCTTEGDGPGRRLPVHGPRRLQPRRAADRLGDADGAASTALPARTP